MPPRAHRGRGLHVVPDRPAAALLLTTVALAACGSDAPPPAGLVVDTVDGVEWLSYGDQSGPALEWTADTLAVIGDVTGDEEYQLGSVWDSGLAGDTAGHVLVLDRQPIRVLEYDRDGRHLATYGRAGGGPGELRFPGALDVGPGDTIWVTDVVNRRLTGYPRAREARGEDRGEPRTVPYPDASSFPSFRAEALPGGGFLQTAGNIGPEATEQEEPLLRLDPDLNPVDTLWAAPPTPTDVVQIEAGGSGVMLRMAREFWPGFEWRALSDGSVVVSDTAEYLIRLLNPEGDLRRVVRRDPPARPATEDDRESVRQRVLAQADSGRGVTYGSGGPDRETQMRIAEERIAHMTFADRIPRIRGLRVDHADRIWVGVTSDSSAREVGRIDIYDRDGRLLGELHDFELPAAFTGPDRLLTLRTDDMDVPQVVVLRVPQMAATETETPGG